MSLTNIQVEALAKRMKVPLVFCGFKSDLCAEQLQLNKSYIVNLEDEYDENGMPNDGSHYTCFQINEYPNGKHQGIYLDSFGIGPPQEVIDFVGTQLPYTKKQIQGLMNNACGFYCLAYLHYINVYPNRLKDLYSDTEHFIDLFDDLSNGEPHLKNEFMLKHFFQSEDKSKRKPIELNYANGIVDPNIIISQDTA